MQIFRTVKKVFFLGLTILSNFTNALDCISMKNRECKVRSEIINVNSNNPMFYPFSIKIIKWHESCKCICRLDKISCNNKQRWNKINVDANAKN